MNIKPYDSTISTLFLSNFFRIPRFQRPYSWDKGNVDDFWSDAVMDGRDQHFIGSMVYYSNKSNGDLFVVDGQQRLTTITIFLAALRDALSEVGEADLAKGVQGFIERQDITAQRRYVLLTESSYPYFQEYIQKDGAPDIDASPSPEEEGMKNAYQYAAAQLREIVTNARASKAGVSAKKTAIRRRLEAIRDALLSLRVIVIQLDNEDEAYVVFETLNTRGKDLEPKDLIKNLLSKLLPAKSADVDTTKLKWSAMIDSLASSSASLDPSTYLHHYWLSMYDYVPERILFDSVKKKLNKSNASDFLKKIQSDVDIYRRIFEPENFDWDKEEIPLRNSLSALSIFKVRQPTPLILAILRCYYGEKISLKQAKMAMGTIEKFHFMYTAVSGLSSSGGVSKMYAAAAKTLSSIADDQERSRHLREFAGKLTERLPEEDVFSVGFNSLRFSNGETRSKQLIQYALAKIDKQDSSSVAVDYGMMTIEHIAPQNPTGLVPVDNYASIGNLILVSEELNGKLKNKSFQDKKKIMTTSGLKLDDTITKASSWGKPEINKRAKALAVAAYRAKF